MLRCFTWMAMSAFFLASTLGADDSARPEPPGLGDPGELVSIEVETGRATDGLVEIAGRDASQQLVVTGQYSTGQLRDLTRTAQYSVAPDSIIQVDPSGHVTPLAEGEATITAVVSEGPAAAIRVRVTHVLTDLPVNFPNQITPIFTKYGCNGGGCHGKSGGQNGFALSLLGFEPSEDYEYLVKEARGRRLFLAAPQRSLLLVKATAEVPHGGGHRIETDSPAYRMIKRWIEQGVPYGEADDPRVVSIVVLPRERIMQRDGQQQLICIARFSDGRSEDVTRMTTFDSNDTEMAEASVSGLVTTTKQTGSVAVMARYQGHVDVFRATIPLGVDVQDLPQATNFIDELVFEKLRSLGLPSSPLASDNSFLRRTTIDIAGRLPTPEEVEAFAADDSPDKRAALIERLLASTDYAEYFANKWAAILRNKRDSNEDRFATFHFYNWLRDSLHQNKHYDAIVRDIVTASGQAGQNPAAAWFREVTDPAAQVEDTAQLFLGLRIQCARCHHHPFEKWSQEDYYGFSAFFSRVGRKKAERPQYDRVFHLRGEAGARNPKTGNMVKPTGLGGEPLQLSPDDDPRRALADWMSEPDNPFFARALVNRYWKHFFGRGLVDPEDDMRVTNPACNPELLDALADSFAESNFDLKQLVRTICNSTVYQLSSEPNAWNENDKQNFSRYYPKRLNAEVLLDAIDQVSATQTNFGQVPLGTRAVALPDNGFNSYFLTVFGRPDASSACECERSADANLAQSLHLLNSSEIQGKLAAGEGRAASLSTQQDRAMQAKIRELFMQAFAREPQPDEAEIAVQYIEKAEQKQQAFEDVIWALINTKEFLFNH